MGLFKKTSRSNSKASEQQESVASSTYDPPNPDATPVIQADAPATSVAASENTAPPPNIVMANGSMAERSTGEGSNGSDDSKKVALLSGEEQDPELGGDDAENKSIHSKASSYVKSQMSVNNSTIATNTLGIGMSDDDSLHSHSLEKKPMKETVMERCTVCCASMALFWAGLSKAAQVSLLVGAALGAVGVIALAASGGRSPAFPANMNVAFVGNSYFYVNDLPRFVQNIAGGHVKQDSCVHNAATILSILMTGNGMWNKWATKKAMINGVKFETSKGTTEYLYDMGACSVPQLLTGHDQMVTEENGLGSFIDDEQNPCFQQDAYREYQESFDPKGGWDFVVITDKSKAMVFDETRNEALAAFNYTYGPLLKKKNISPIIVQPHAYSSDGANSTGLADLTTFTALIMNGAEIYRKYLGQRIGWFSRAHIAPVGNAFLSVYEEDPYGLYPKLFLDDGIHPSAYGTFLYGCVIYATMTGYMPKYNRVVVDDMENSDLFATARRLQASSSSAGFPSKDEAAILYKIAKKVAVRGYTPKVMRGFKLEEGAADFLKENNDNDNVYDSEFDEEQYQSYYQEYNNMYQDANNYAGYYGNDNNANNYGGGYGNNNQGGGNYNNAYNQGYEQYYYSQQGNGNGGYGGNYANNDDAANQQNGQQQQYYSQQGNGYGGYGGNYANNDDAAQQENQQNGQQQQYYSQQGNGYGGNYANNYDAQQGNQQNGQQQYYYNQQGNGNGGYGG